MSPNKVVTVLLGGPSAEREVSLRTGAAVARALRSLGHEVHEVDPDPSRAWRPAAGTEVVFMALHGTYGEDGQAQRVLDAMGIPYTGCDAESSAVAFDKILTKRRCIEAGVPTPRFEVVESRDGSWPAGFPVPAVLKPARQGSSVGLRFIDSPGEWEAARDFAFQHGDSLLLEERVVGRETTVAVLDGRALPIVEVRPKSGHYDYANKYTAGATEYLCPAPFSREVAGEIQKAALSACHAVGVRDYARVDVMVSRDLKPFVLEVNTLPGMTETSLFPKAALAAGIEYPELCQRMIDLAARRK